MRTVAEFAAMDLQDNIAQFERDDDDQNDSVGCDADWVSCDIENAAFALTERGEVGINYLLEALLLADTPHTQAALTALGALKPVPEKVRKLLVHALDDDRLPVLFAAIQGLRWAEDRQQIDRVLELRNHESPHVCAASIEYISELFPVMAIDHIESALTDDRYLVRTAMLDELDETEDEELAAHAVPNAWKFVGDPHPDVRSAATWLLEHHYWDTKSPWEIAAERNNADPLIRASAVRASAHNNIESAPEILAKALNDPDRIVRINALEELEELYSAWYKFEVLPELADITRFLNDDDLTIRDAAKEANSAWNRRQNRT
jgi:HEAT repeat protein